MGVLSKLLSSLGGGEPAEYSSAWFDALSDDELDEERERVRLDWVNPELSDGKRARSQQLLWRFDDKIRERRHGDSEPGYPVHSEHGWYLPDDD